VLWRDTLIALAVAAVQADLVIVNECASRR
jgi:hypothetical protein